MCTTPAIKRWDLCVLPLHLSWAYSCLDQENVKELTFWEFWVQAFKNPGSFYFLPFGTQPPCNGKLRQSLGEAYMKETQTLLPHPRASSKLHADSQHQQPTCESAILEAGPPCLATQPTQHRAETSYFLKIPPKLPISLWANKWLFLNN